LLALVLISTTKALRKNDGFKFFSINEFVSDNPHKGCTMLEASDSRMGLESNPHILGVAPPFLTKIVI
jgi:hypothetical protein